MEGERMIHEQMFTEKYRPTTLTEVIGGDELRGLYDGICNDPWTLPNILLTTRSAGTGKTTIARAIIKDIGADSLFLNASDDRGINTIRDKVKEFAMTQGFTRTAPKVVHLDEADGLTKEAQESLRSIMEQYSSNCRFIFTCNNGSKIIEPIKSRCVQINLNNPPRDKIYQRLNFISVQEDMNLKSDTIDDIIEFFYPDIRLMINELDYLKHFGETSRRNVASEVYELLRKRKFTEARKLWISEQISPRLLVKEIYTRVMADDKLSKEQIVLAVEYVAETDFRIAMGSDAEITLANLAIKLVSAVFK
jgi:replication factor C small subunit